MRKALLPGLVGVVCVAALSPAQDAGEKIHGETVSVFVPPWEGIFRIDQKDLIRVDSRSFDQQQVVIEIQGPAKLQRTLSIVPDKEHSAFSEYKNTGGPRGKIVEGIHRQYEIRPTGPGRVTVTIDVSTKREFNGRRLPVPEGPHEVTEYGFIVE